MGLAASITGHRSLREALIQALEMVAFCCSMALWILLWSDYPILSNTSASTRTLSASIITSVSSLLSLVSILVANTAYFSLHLQRLDYWSGDGQMHVSKSCLRRMNLQEAVKETCVHLLLWEIFAMLLLKMHPIVSFSAKHCWLLSLVAKYNFTHQCR